MEDDYNNNQHIIAGNNYNVLNQYPAFGQSLTTGRFGASTPYDLVGTNSPAFANPAPTISAKQLRHNSRSTPKDKEELTPYSGHLRGQQYPQIVTVGQDHFIVSEQRSKEALKDLSDKSSSSPNGSSSSGDSSSSGV